MKQAYAIVNKRTNEVVAVELTRSSARITKSKIEPFKSNNHKMFKIVQMVEHKEVR